MTRKEHSKALRAHPQVHYNCAQAVLIPFAQDMGLTPEQANALTLNFGAGMGCGAVCGAISGAFVAMGGLGAEAAIETADVVILDDNPARLPELLRIARRTRTIVWQNIVMALGIKGLFMALGIVGLSGLWPCSTPPAPEESTPEAQTPPRLLPSPGRHSRSRGRARGVKGLAALAGHPELVGRKDAQTI